MVLLEASSYGMPCVSFDILTGPSDIIEDGKSGFLVADNDLSAYALIIVTIVTAVVIGVGMIILVIFLLRNHKRKIF